MKFNKVLEEAFYLINDYDINITSPTKKLVTKASKVKKVKKYRKKFVKHRR